MTQSSDRGYWMMTEMNNKAYFLIILLIIAAVFYREYLGNIWKWPDDGHLLLKRVKRFSIGVKNHFFRHSFDSF